MANKRYYFDDDGWSSVFQVFFLCQQVLVFLCRNKKWAKKNIAWSVIFVEFYCWYNWHNKIFRLQCFVFAWDYIIFKSLDAGTFFGAFSDRGFFDDWYCVIAIITIRNWSGSHWIWCATWRMSLSINPKDRRTAEVCLFTGRIKLHRTAINLRKTVVWQHFKSSSFLFCLGTIHVHTSFEYLINHKLFSSGFPTKIQLCSREPSCILDSCVYCQIKVLVSFRPKLCDHLWHIVL